MNKEDKLLRWFYLLLLALIWGSSFILMKRGLVAFRADQVAAIRMSVAFISLFPFVVHRFRHVKKKYFKYIFATGLLGNGIPAFLFAFAQVHVASAMAGMLNSLTPVFVVLVGALIFRSRFKASHLVGVVTGLAGAVSLILVHSKGGIAGTHAGYALLIVLATVCYAFSVSIIRHFLHEIHAVHITGFALFAAGIPCLAYLLSTDFITRLQTVPGAWFSFGCVVALALLSTSLSTVLFNKLIKISNALYASSVTYLIPIVAILWGLADGEPLTWLHVGAMALILGGVYLINLEGIKEMKKKKETPAGSNS